MQKREMPIKYSSATAGWLWIAYGKDFMRHYETDSLRCMDFKGS